MAAAMRSRNWTGTEFKPAHEFILSLIVPSLKSPSIPTFKPRHCLKRQRLIHWPVQDDDDPRIELHHLHIHAIQLEDVTTVLEVIHLDEHVHVTRAQNRHGGGAHGRIEFSFS